MDGETRTTRTPHSPLWADIRAVLSGQGMVKASRILEALSTFGHDTDNENVKTRIYNALGRWAREGKLCKTERGMYGLPDADEVVVGVAHNLPHIPGVLSNQQGITFRAHITPRDGETPIRLLEALLHEIRAGMVRCELARRRLILESVTSEGEDDEA